MTEAPVKLSHNLLYQLLYQGLTLFYPLLTMPFLSRVFGTEGIGIYSYTYSIAYYFSLCASLGVHTYGSRAVSVYRNSREKISSTFWNLYAIQSGCSLLTIALYFLYTRTLRTRLYQPGLLQGIVLLAAMADISWFLSGLEQFRTMAIRNFLVKLSSLFLIFGLIKSKKDLGLYIVIMAGTNLMGQLSMWPAAVRVLDKPRIHLPEIRKHFPAVCKLFLPVVALNAYVLLDKAMLGIFRTMEEVGYYENSDRLIKMPVGLAGAVCAVLLPRASFYVAGGEDERNNRMTYRTLRILLLFMIPIIIGMIGIAPEFVPWYLGGEFLPCIRILQALAPIILFMVTGTVLRYQYFIANNKDGEYTKSIILAAVVNLCLNLLLMKPFGVFGVIAGSMISEIYATVYLVIRTKHVIPYRRLLRESVPVFTAALVMGVLLRGIGKKYGGGFRTNLIQIFAGIAVYFVLLGGLTAVGRFIQTRRNG